MSASTCRIFLTDIILVFLFACVTHSSGMVRLPTEIRPISQSISLKMNPEEADYSGTVEILLKVSEKTERIMFHAENLNIETIDLFYKNKKQSFSVDSSVVGLIKLISDNNFEEGEYELNIDFSNDFSTRANALYRLKVDSLSYAFSQFEPDDARESFPCWDEPEFKFPYQITITIPDNMTAVGNTPIESEEISDGWKKVTFMKTPPLPSYLLAIACGEFEYTEILGMSVPGRVVTVKGKSHLAGHAAEVTPPLLKAMEEYFGQPYPYKKLDLLAVPEYWAGAMENPGAITYRETILLIDPNSVSVSQERSLAATTSHELAHMWFGDLVTLAWWDDIWLNESFASWMGDKITHEVYPEYKTDVSVVSSNNRAMVVDSRPSTKPARKEILPTDNLEDSFNALAYNKGQALISMFENWMGEEKFRAGVISYIKENEWKTADAAKFFNALTVSSGEKMEETMALFLDRAGLPIINLDMLGDGRVKLSQKRFTNYGVTAPEEYIWTVPVQLKYSDGINSYNKTVMLKDASMEVSLPSEGKLAWVYPDNGAFGYYRWNIPKEMLLTIASTAPKLLMIHERVAFLKNLTALFDAGAVSGETFMKVLASFGSDPEPQVVSAVISGISKIHHTFVVENNEASFASYINLCLKPALKRFGLEKSDTEDAVVTSFRPRMISLLADEGKDVELIEYAKGLAIRFEQDPTPIDPSMVSIIMNISALDGDDLLFEKYKSKFENAKIPRMRSIYLYSLGMFRDKAIIEKAKKYVFEGPLKPQEIFVIPFAFESTPKNDQMMLDWIMEDYVKFLERIPPFYVSRLTRVANGCSAERLKIATEFFTDSSRIVSGTMERLEKIGDQVADCISLRERESESVQNYLNSL